MAQNGGRISCPKCGANNFDTVSACWKCSAPLAGGAVPMQINQSTMPVQPAYASQQTPQNYAVAPVMAPERNPYYPQTTPVAFPADDGDLRMAKRAALLLAWTLPFFGLPIGWTLMMIQNRQRQEIGRFCATWSLVAFLVHTILFGILAAQSTPLLLKIMTSVYEKQNQGGSGGGAGSSPNLGNGSE